MVMIDVILLVFVLAVFYGGFYLGAKYQTLRATWSAFTGWIENL